MTIKKRLAGLAVALTAVLMAAGCSAGTGSGGNGGDAKPTINIGYFPVVSPVPLMQEQKLLEKAGYTVNWVKVDKGLPGAASALAAGKLDASWGNSASATVIFSQSPKAAYFVGQSFTNENITVVSKASGITKIKQLDGKKIVVSGPKTASTLFFEIGLKQAGGNPKSTEYFVSGTGPGMVGVLDSGDVQAAATYVPYAASMVLKGIGTVLFTGSDAMDSPAPGDGFIVSQKFAKAHKQAVIDLLKAQFTATDEIKDHPDKAYKTMAKFAGVDEAAVKYSFQKKLVGIPDTYVPDVKGLTKVATMAQDLGFSPKKDIDLPGFVPDFVKTSYAKEALGE